MFMLIDGIHVILFGKYIGPQKPGPWAILPGKLGLDVFRFGPLFCAFGIMWLFFLYGLIMSASWYLSYGIVLSVMTLWYLPIGTLLSVIILACLISSRSQ